MAANPSSRNGTRNASSSGKRSGLNAMLPSRSTRALDAIADAMISPWTFRLSYFAVMSHACVWLSHTMPLTRTTRPSRLARTMRRASDEKK